MNWFVVGVALWFITLALLIYFRWKAIKSAEATDFLEKYYEELDETP